MEPDITVLVNLHRGGHLTYPALRSAFLAAEHAAHKGIAARVMAVIDRGDAATRRQVQRFRDRLAAIHEIDHGDLGQARNYGIERIDTRYVATLDGDDFFDPDWLWKGVCFLEREGDGRTVAHCQVRLSFGSERHGRLQVSSESHLFHPLNLVGTWHYAAEVLLPTAIYRQHPFIRTDPAHGLSSEDWHWTCESIAAGIRHLVVPETVYFYRRQANHLSLGMLPGVTFPTTRLLDPRAVAALRRDHPSAAMRLAHRAEGIAGPQERWPRIPCWLKHSIRRACGLELELYELHDASASLALETPPFYPAVGRLYATLMDGIDPERPSIVLFSDRLSEADLGLVEGFLAALRRRRSPPLNLLVIVLAPGWERQGQGQFPWNPEGTRLTGQEKDLPWLRLRCLDLGGEAIYCNLHEYLQKNLLTRFLIQVRPALVINAGCGRFDRLVGDFGRAITAASAVRTVRICRGRRADPGDAAAAESWQGLALSGGNHSLALCESAPVAAWLGRAFFGAETVVRACRAPKGQGADQAFGEALHRLLREEGALPAGVETQGPPPERLPADSPPAAAIVARPQVSCVLTVRSEGEFLNPALEALTRMRSDALGKGIATEWVVVADSVGPRTLKVLSTLAHRLPGARVIEVDRDDEAGARNAGIAVAQAPLVAVLTGADIVSPGWLSAAVSRIEGQDAGTIVHPHAEIRLEGGLRIAFQPELEGSGPGVEYLVAHQGWTVHALARRELFQRFPYHPAPPSSGYGRSVWHWNCETVAAGCRHLTVPDTAVYRRTPGSGGDRQLRLGAVSRGTMPPSRFFSAHPWLERHGGGRKKGWRDELVFALFKMLARMAGDPRRREDLSAPPTWDEQAYIAAHPDVRWAVAAGRYASGLDHFQRHGQVEGRTPCWLGAPFMAELRALCNLEPAFHPATACTPTIHAAKPSAAADLYRACRKILGRADATHIVVAAALRPGGAELSMLHMLEAILAAPGNRALLITTEAGDERWRHRLPARCTWLPFASLASGSPPEEQAELLIRLLINSGARNLHFFFSDLGWLVLRRHAAALARHMRLYVSIFIVPPVETGHGCGHARFLGELEPNLSAILTDNRHAAETLATVCGIDPEKVTVIKHPAVARQRFSGPPRGCAQVLWASRLDRDKNPGLLAAVAERLPHITFHAYGTPVLDDTRHVERLRRVPNIQYRGPFCGFDTIPAAPYLCLLYSSRWDGLPNILLEAMAAGLLVVAPDVGGVAELVDDQTGVLIRKAGDPEAFAAAIAAIARDPGPYRVLAQNGQRRVAGEHTLETFREGVARIPGYL